MDLSSEYVKMCRASKEIQVSWNFKDGDYLVSDSDSDVTVWSGYDATEYPGVPYNDNPIWIPRQDQLQDMIGISNLDDLIYHDACIVSQYYDGVSIDEYYKSFASLEMTFLAMVMKCNYGKKWNGSEWV